MDLDTKTRDSASQSAAREAGAARVMPPKTVASEADLRRRAKIGPLGFSHCAVRSRDIEATRHFYEDVIGLPLVLIERGRQLRHPLVAEPFDMMHFFFELADGSLIGFFGIEKDKIEPFVLPNNPLQYHFSVQMESEQAVLDAEVRVREAGYKCAVMDHGSAYSLYVQDPDAMQFEMCYHRPNWVADVDLTKTKALFGEWVANGERWA